ncbi:hypothetical protein AB0K51_29140 [Kitasatospora sp. NPDC049285]|uniref:hypothetical protein n=1 Tax=Kitasatospora sp. NPDC049285 TaxID=3157096 RepID=UPI00341E43D5
MHTGDNGAPLSPHQLADVLLAAYDRGNLDGKTRIDFLSCRLGEPAGRHVPEAMRALWAHQTANPRPAAAGPFTGRAPAGDLWIAPTTTGHHTVVLADHLGLRPDGTPAVVTSHTSHWRTYTHAGDPTHIALETDHPHDNPPADLEQLDGAVKFGPERRPSQTRGYPPARSGPVGVGRRPGSAPGGEAPGGTAGGVSGVVLPGSVARTSDGDWRKWLGIAFRSRIAHTFEQKANSVSVSVNSKVFKLPEGARRALFAHQVLRGTRLDDVKRVRFTNPAGDHFEASLGDRPVSEELFQPGTRPVFGVFMTVPTPPADRGNDPAFVGWYGRLVDEDGQRCVAWSLTGGEEFRAEPERTPYDEPPAVYRRRLAQERRAASAAAAGRGISGSGPEADPGMSALPHGGTGAAGDVAMGTRTADGPQGGELGTGESRLHAEQPRQGLLVLDPVSGTVTAIHPDGTITEPGFEEAMVLAAESGYTVLTGSPDQQTDTSAMLYRDERPLDHVGPAGDGPGDGTGVSEPLASAGAGALLSRLDLTVDPVLGDGNCFFRALARMRPEHGTEADLRAALARDFGNLFDDFTVGPTLLAEVLTDSRLLYDLLQLTPEILPYQLADAELYTGLLARLRSEFGPVWAAVLDQLTVDRRWDNAFGSAAPLLYTRYSGRGLLIADVRSGTVTAVHTDYSTTYPDPEQAARLASDHGYPVLAHRPGHYDATTSASPATDSRPEARRRLGGEPGQTGRPEPAVPPHGGDLMEFEPFLGRESEHAQGESTPPPGAPAVGGEHPGQAPRVLFLKRVRHRFHLVAGATKASTNGVILHLPRGSRRALFANQPLNGRVDGKTVTLTTLDGRHSYEVRLDGPREAEAHRAAGAKTTVFGVKTIVPDVPADHPDGEPFGGWYARLAGKVGRRVIVWSRTSGEAFTPEDALAKPYDEPDVEYKYRVAVEKMVGRYVPLPVSLVDPANRGAFLERVAEQGRAAATSSAVSVAGRTFHLPADRKTRRLFADQPLDFVRTGNVVTFSTLAGDRFSVTLARVVGRQVRCTAGDSAQVFDLSVMVPKVPADHPAGEAFGGWYARLAGEDGRRVVEWSRTPGDGFTAEGDPTPYDEPDDEYAFRIAVEAQARARAAEESGVPAPPSRATTPHRADATDEVRPAAEPVAAVDPVGPSSPRGSLDLRDDSGDELMPQADSSDDMEYADFGDEPSSPAGPDAEPPAADDSARPQTPTPGPDTDLVGTSHATGSAGAPAGHSDDPVAPPSPTTADVAMADVAMADVAMADGDRSEWPSPDGLTMSAGPAAGFLDTLDLKAEPEAGFGEILDALYASQASTANPIVIDDGQPTPTRQEPGTTETTGRDTPNGEPRRTTGDSSPVQAPATHADHSPTYVRTPDIQMTGAQTGVAQAPVAGVPAVGDLVPVPGDGLCLLSSVVVSDPLAVREGLIHAGVGDSDLDRILADRVRPGAVPDGIRTLAEGVRDAVRTWLTNRRTADVPAEIVRVLRASTLEQRRESLRSMPRGRIEQQLRDLGVDSIPNADFLTAEATYRLLEAAVAASPRTDLSSVSAALAARVRWQWDPERADAARHQLTIHRIEPSADPTILRDQLIDLTAREAFRNRRREDLAVAKIADWIGWRFEDRDPNGTFQQILDHQPTGRLPLDLLDRDGLAALLLAQDTPLTAQELRDTISAVRTWESSWNGPYGEVLPPLLAHALGIRLRIAVHGDTDHIEHLGPPDAPVVTVHHTGNHYDASAAVTPPRHTRQPDDGTGYRDLRTGTAGSRRRDQTGTRGPVRAGRVVMPVVDWATFRAPLTARQKFEHLTSINPTPPRPAPQATPAATPAPRRTRKVRSTPESTMAFLFVYGSAQNPALTLGEVAELSWHGRDVPTVADVHTLLMTHESAYRRDYRRLHELLADAADPRSPRRRIKEFAEAHNLHRDTVGYWATLEPPGAGSA